MKLLKKRRYYFSDDSIASDTIIADVMAIISLIIEIIGIVMSFVTRGNVHEIFGTLYLCAAVLTIVGIVFSIIGRKAEEGSEGSKRLSFVLNILSAVIILWLFILGVK